MKGNISRLTRNMHKLVHCKCFDEKHFFVIDTIKTHICDTCKMEIPIGQAYLEDGNESLTEDSFLEGNFQDIEGDNIYYYHVKCIHKKVVEMVKTITEQIDEGVEI